MSLSESDKLRLTRGVIQKLRWALLDKPGPVIAPTGQIYGATPPYERCAVGSIGASPESAGGQERWPDTMGLTFLVSPPANGPLVLEVEGRFDVAHAYIPAYTDQAALLRSVSGARAPQELLETYIRHTVTFAPARFEIALEEVTDLTDHGPLQDTVRQALLAHLAAVARDPRVYRLLASPAYAPPRKCVLEWTESIVDQDSLNAAVHRDLFEPQAGALPYDLELQCRVQPALDTMCQRAPSVTAADGGPREYLVEVFLTNKTTRGLAQRYRLPDPQVMDVNLRVRIAAGQHRPMRSSEIQNRDSRRSNSLSDGYGSGCTLVRAADGALLTEALPTYEQPRMEDPDPLEIGMQEALRLDILMREPMPLLADFLQAMQRYRDRWRCDLEKEHAPEGLVGTDAYREWQEFAEHTQCAARGIECLGERPAMLRAFCLMNEAMLESGRVQGKAFQTWRPIQLVLTLAQIPHLIRRAEPLKLDTEREEEIADVVLSDTGSGKTAVYFAVVGINMFYHRLIGRAWGIAGWLRSPARALSGEQCQRTAFVVAAAERLRVRDQLGGFPFTVGFFVGRATTPNDTSAPQDIDNYIPTLIDQAKTDPSVLERLRLLEDCPYCTSPLEVQLVAWNFRIKHVCVNAKCFSNEPVAPEQAHLRLSGEIGFYITDREFYRHLPTFALGTFDKIVVVAHAPLLRTLFAATHFCPSHGFLTQSTCKYPTVDKIGDDWSDPVPCNNNRHSSVRTFPLGRPIDPGIPIIVQDDFSVSAEELGSLDANYISLWDEIQRSHPKGRMPKIIAGSATVRDVKRHGHNLLLRRTRCFAARRSGMADSFYSRRKRDPQTGEPAVARTYLAALPRLPRKARVADFIQEASRRFHAEQSALCAAFGEHPEKTCQEFGLKAEQAAAARKYLRCMLSRDLIYVRTMRDAGRIERRFDRENRLRRLSGRMPRSFIRLDRQTPLAVIQREINWVPTDDSPGHSVLATSVIAVGTHMSWLNAMFMTGWPLSTSEFIQTSSRCARQETGFVLVGMDANNLFEASAYTHFLEFLQGIEQHIEPVPTDRFALQILRRVLPGVFKGLVFHARLAHVGRRRINTPKRLREALLDPQIAAALEDRIMNAYGFDRAERLGVFNARQLKEAREYILGEARRLIVSKQQPQLSAEAELLAAGRLPEEEPALSSLRDIEPHVSAKAVDDPDLRVWQAIRGARAAGRESPAGPAEIDLEITYGRLFYEEFLPGGVVALPGSTSGLVVGTDSDDQLTHLVNPELMEAILGEELVRFEREGGQVQAPYRKGPGTSQWVIRTPRTIYVTPFPLGTLVCSNPKCLLADVAQDTSHSARVAALAGRIRGHIPYIPCRGRDCGAPLRQLPYVYVHGCGLILPLMPHATLHSRLLCFVDRGDVERSGWRDPTTGEYLGGCSPPLCPRCLSRWEKAQASRAERAESPESLSPRPQAVDALEMVAVQVRGGRAETFFPRLMRFLALTPETSRRLAAFRAQVTPEELGRAVACGLLGLQTAEALRQNLHVGAKQPLGPIQVASVADRYRKLEANFENLQRLPGMEPTAALVKEELLRLGEQLHSGRDLFKPAEQYISDPQLLAELGSHHRAVEAGLFSGEFKERSKALEIREETPARRLLLEDECETLLRVYGVREVSYLETLTMALAAGGYTRQVAAPRLSSRVPVRLNFFKDPVNQAPHDAALIYAHGACTEAICVQLDPCRMVRFGMENLGWAPPAVAVSNPTAALSFILTVAPALASSPAAIQQLAFKGPDTPQNRAAVHVFGVLHSTAHALLRAAQRSSGYNFLSLGEYILSAGLGIVIHVVPRKTLVTGALRALYEHALHPWFEAARQGLTCFDPGCVHNGGSCKACTHLPLGCELHNHRLSRGYLQGGIVPKVMGDRLHITKGFWT